jgi:hypothetical protein
MEEKKMKKIVLLLVLMSVIGAVMVNAQSNSDSLPAVQVTLLNQDPDPARAGDTVNVRFKIENAGGTAVSDAQVEVLQDFPFTLASRDAIKNIGDLNAYLTDTNYITFDYTLKIDKDNIQPQRELRLRYRYDNGIWRTQSFSINLASKEFAQIIYVDKAKLDPGKETDLKFTVTNLGNAPLQNLIFSWDESTGSILPVYSSDTRYVKYLDVGQSVDLDYKVIANVNAEPGLYQLDLKLRSESVNNATQMNISTKAGIFIGGETNFDVAFSESTQGQTSLSVSNTGNNPAQSVSVTIPQQAGYRVSGSNSAIIGNLDKGDYTLVSFQIVSNAAGNVSGQGRQGLQQDSNQSSTGFRERLGNNTFGNASNNPNNLRVVIDYTDTIGERRSVEKTVPIQFRSLTTGTVNAGTTATGFSGRAQQNFIGSTLFWILLILIVAVAEFFILKNKAARREKAKR